MSLELKLAYVEATDRYIVNLRAVWLQHEGPEVGIDETLKDAYRTAKTDLEQGDETVLGKKLVAAGDWLIESYEYLTSKDRLNRVGGLPEAIAGYEYFSKEVEAERELAASTPAM